MAEDAVKGRPHCRFERAHITRVTLDACEVEIVFHTDVADYVVFMDARQGVTLALMAGWVELYTLARLVSAPAGGGVLTTAWNVMVSDAPGASVPLVNKLGGAPR